MELGFRSLGRGIFVIAAIVISRSVSTAAPVVEDASAHVLIISIDGGGPSFLAKSRMPTLQKIVQTSAVTWNARTVNPNITLPSHVSMLTGVSPSRHKITWNTWSPKKGLVAVPTVFALAKQAGLSTALFTAKDKFQHLNVPGTLDKFFLLSGTGFPVAQAAGEFIVTNKPNLIFVHLPDADIAGHRYGWGSSKQKQALENVDKSIELLISAVKRAGISETTNVIITADHGGSGLSHGSSKAVNWTIPWIVNGPGVRAGTVISKQVRTMDSTATALWLLGVDGADIEGEPVTEAFELN